jgi:predicted amidohydrolase
MKTVRVGLVQMCSTADVAENLGVASEYVSAAAKDGAHWVALPENFAYMRREGEPVEVAQSLDGEIAESLRAWARSHQCWILGGTFAECIPDSDKVYNTSLLLSPEGEIAGHYRKIHLFDVELGASGGGSYQESSRYQAGQTPVVATTPFGPVGMSVCYDLRFPELYRSYADQSARFLCVPSAFAPATGKDHWEVLLRARAIENQAFVVAPAQSGAHSSSRESYGRSMVVDPWGLILATIPDGPGFAVVDCSLPLLESVRASVPALLNRRLGSTQSGAV